MATDARRRYELRHRTLWTIALGALPGGPSRRLVAYALATFATPDGRTAEPPGRHELAEAAGVDVSTVRRALLDLERDGWIHRTHPGGGRGHRAQYALVIPAAAEEYIARRKGGVVPRKGGVVPVNVLTPSTQNATDLVSSVGDLPAGEKGGRGAPHSPAVESHESVPPWVAEGLTWHEWRTAREEGTA